MQSSTNYCDFTDVTLAMHDGPKVCRHYQTGFCKFGESCRKQHVKESCQITKCNLKICTKRHPKVCKYFKQHQFCKFGDSCSYRHDIFEPSGCPLEKQLESLKATVVKMSAVICNLEEKIARLENVSILEIERDTLTLGDNSIQLSVPEEDREEVSTPPIALSPSTEERQVKSPLKKIREQELNLQVEKCEACEEEFDTEDDLDIHMETHGKCMFCPWCKQLFWDCDGAKACPGCSTPWPT